MLQSAQFIHSTVLYHYDLYAFTKVTNMTLDGCVNSDTDTCRFFF